MTADTPSLTTVSVITPSLNQGRYIGKTIESVLNQAGNLLIDYIIMDGGSHDETVDVIRKTEQLLATPTAASFHHKTLTFRSSVSPIACAGLSFRWFSEPDRGQTHALKKAFRLARGDIFCWLNSDDYYLNHTVLERATGYFRDNPNVRLLFGDGIYTDADGRLTAVHHTAAIRLREMIYLDCHILQPAAFFRREIYDETLLDESLSCAFDAHFFTALISRGIPFLKVADPFAAFRFYPETKTQALHKRKTREMNLLTEKYGNSPYRRLISRIYRFLESRLRPVFHQKKGVKAKLFAVLRRACYRLIMGVHRS